MRRNKTTSSGAPTMWPTLRTCRTLAAALLLGLAVSLLAGYPVEAADHNDPNAVNSIFSDVPISPADLYDFFGFPGDGTGEDETVVLALTFASIPQAGVLDPDFLYRVMISPGERVAPALGDDRSLGTLLRYAKGIKRQYKRLDPAEIRVRVDGEQRVHATFLGFPGGTFARTLATNEVTTLEAPGGHRILAFVGGRDDAFFNDLPGFFRSINYGPQFYEVPRSKAEARELPIPKTLLELEGNELFNFDPERPDHGTTVKLELPPGPWTFEADGYRRDADGNFRFVYSGQDAQAGINVNAIVFELPLAFLTRQPARHRIVNAWGESWVDRESPHAAPIPDRGTAFGRGLRRAFGGGDEHQRELARYKVVDTDGVPFLDAALSERRDSWQIGAENARHARGFVTRYGHLGWGFGPSITALGLGTCFDHGDVELPVHRTYDLATAAFPRVKDCLFQTVNMPDDSWKRNGVEVRLKRPVEIFLPNVCAIDMDTNGTWPYGRRLEDQVATRFLSLFLAMADGCGGAPCHVESLSDQALWDAAPIEPKTPPNPLANDKPFLDRFPYLAEPW